MNLIEQMKNRKLLSLNVEVAYPSKDEPIFKLKFNRPPAVEINEVREIARRVVSKFNLEIETHRKEYFEELGSQYFKLCEKHLAGWESSDIEFNPENKKLFFETLAASHKTKDLGFALMIALTEDENKASKKSQADTVELVAPESAQS